MNTRFQTRDGANLALHMRGDGPPVVFQHGLCGDARQTFEAFPETVPFRLLTLECRGHGASDRRGPFSIATFADDLIDMIETLGHPVILGGISMGAAIASRIAVIRPDLVQALILVRPAWVTIAAPPNMLPVAEAGHLIAEHGTEARRSLDASPLARCLAAEAPDNLSSLAGFFDREPLAVTADLTTGIAADGPGITAAALQKLAIPTMVFGSDEDVIHPYAMAAELAALIPGASLIRLPPKGRDKPVHLAALHAAITDFLKDLPDAETRT